MATLTLAADPLTFTVNLSSATFSTGHILNAAPLAFNVALSNAALTPQVTLGAAALPFHFTLGSATLTYVNTQRSPVIVQANLSDMPYVTVLTSVGPSVST